MKVRNTPHTTYTKYNKGSGIVATDLAGLGPLYRYLLVCLWAKTLTDSELTWWWHTLCCSSLHAQVSDPVLVHRLLCHFTHLIMMGFVGVVVRADLAR